MAGEEVIDRDFETEARQQGWKPVEEFQGDPDKWVDAQTFVERGEQFVGFLKPRLDKMEKALRHQEQLNKDLTAHYKRFEAQAQKEREELERKLIDARQKAISEGDGQAFTKADNELERLRQEQRSQPQREAEVGELSPTAQKWLADNEWYTKDRAARAVADSYANELRSTNPTISEEDYFKAINEYVKNELPHKFTNMKRGEVPDVETQGGRKTPTASGRTPKAKTYANLPPEAKAACDRMVQAGMVSNKEDYAKAYFESEE